MKYLVLILCLFLNLHFSLGQEVFKPCVTDERVDGSPKGGRASENGWQLPTEGELSILIIFAEVEYILIDDDPEPTGTTDWPVGDLPSFKDNIVDPVFPSLGNFQGDLTRFYAEASLNELELTGDYLELDRGAYLIKVTTNNGEVLTSLLYKN